MYTKNKQSLIRTKKNKLHKYRVTLPAISEMGSKEKRSHSVGSKKSKEKSTPTSIKKKLTAALTRKTRLSNVLKSACKNSANCIALGMYRPHFERLFNNFADFEQLDESRISHVGGISRNGFVLKLPFEKDGYTAHTILKSAQTPRSDNLVYEYLVGKKFINTMCDKFPCFLETYSLYQYRHEGYLYAAKSYMSSDFPRFQSVPFKHMVTPAEVDWEKACNDNTLFSVLIQYFDNVQSFRSAVEDFENSKYDIFQLLYQVYYVLDTLKDVYTHYDLHGENVLLYKPFKGNTYMKMHYHQPDGSVIVIHSEWIVKLIDYGRNFFKTSTDSSESVINDIMNTMECMDNDSVNIIKGIRAPPLLANIDPVNANASHDLQLLREVDNYLYSIQVEDLSKREFGFEYKSTDSSGVVRNVSDMRRTLEEPQNQLIMKKYEQKYSTWECGGEMHIYADGRPYTIRLNPSPIIDAPVPKPPQTRNPSKLDLSILTQLLNPAYIDQWIKYWGRLYHTIHNPVYKVKIIDSYRQMLIFYLTMFIIQQHHTLPNNTSLTSIFLACAQIVTGVTFSAPQMARDVIQYIKRQSMEIICLPEHAPILLNAMENETIDEIETFHRILMAPFQLP